MKATNKQFDYNLFCLQYRFLGSSLLYFMKVAMTFVYHRQGRRLVVWPVWRNGHDVLHSLHVAELTEASFTCARLFYSPAR